MITWWVTEAMPMPVVALLPLILFPILHISDIKSVSANYTDPVIFLFMGGFMLGLAIEKWNLHRRIALGIVKITGTSGNRIILGDAVDIGSEMRSFGIEPDAITCDGGGRNQQGSENQCQSDRLRHGQAPDSRCGCERTAPQRSTG